MISERQAVALAAAITAMLVSGCATRSVRTVQRPGQDLIVLLPDPDSGVVGRAAVSNPAGSVDLSAARDATIVSANQPPAPVTRLSEAEVKRIFDDVLTALPMPPRHFTLNFKFDSDELTDASRRLLPLIRQTVRDRPVPDVIVIGHTDRVGAPAGNVDLGLKRANMVRGLLVAAGLDPSSIQVTSHGETDLLIPTADGVSEPRNRRVDISVR